MIEEREKDLKAMRGGSTLGMELEESGRADDIVYVNFM